MKIEETSKSKPDWQKIIEEQEKSGLSQAEYCKQNNLDAAKLSYYRGRFKLKQRLASGNNAEFNTVKFSQSIASEVIKLSLPNGFQCEFLSHLDAMQIKKLVEALLTC